MDVSLNGGTPQNTPTWSFSVGKPMVVGYPYFWKHPYDMGLLDIKIYAPWNKQQKPLQIGRDPKGIFIFQPSIFRCQLLVSGRVFDSFNILCLKYGWWFRLVNIYQNLHRFIPPSQVVVWDFWTINSIETKTYLFWVVNDMPPDLSSMTQQLHHRHWLHRASQ